jgi:DNA-binding NarL/FixJ family response regulator
MGEKMRILIVDDKLQVRSALRLLLEHEPGLSVVGEADSVAGLLVQVGAVLPDLVLLDWQLPGLDAAELVPYLRALRPGMLIAALVGLPTSGGEATAFADTVVSRLDPPERILAALANCWPREAGRKHPPSCRRLELAEGDTLPVIPVVGLLP